MTATRLVAYGVDASEPLGTGTLLLLDGRRAGPGVLTDPAGLDALVYALAAQLGEEATRTVTRVEENDGSSHGLPLDEAHLVLHTFPDVGAFAFKAFSRHAIPDADLFQRVLATLHAGRFDSAVRRRAAGLPHDAPRLAARLKGERAWARARLVPLPHRT